MIGSLKGQSAGDHLEERNAERPDIRRRAEFAPAGKRVGVVAGQLLGGSVRRRAAHVEVAPLARPARVAPVGEHGVVARLAEAHVVGLDVAVQEAAGVGVAERGEQLAEDTRGLPSR